MTDLHCCVEVHLSNAPRYFLLRPHSSLWQSLSPQQIFSGERANPSNGKTPARFGATLPHARRHGVASAVVRESLFGARTMGYHIAALQATEMGEPVYRGLGFEACGSVNFYFLPETSEE